MSATYLYEINEESHLSDWMLLGSSLLIKDFIRLIRWLRWRGICGASFDLTGETDAGVRERWLSGYGKSWKSESWTR